MAQVTWRFGVLAAWLLVSAAGTFGQADGGEAAPLDLVLRGGTIIDGTGADRRRGDVGIRDGRIVEIGDLADRKAAKVIDARGKIVAPGFIDLHSHADGGLVHADPQRRAAPNLISQGITTVVVNQDGWGPESIAEQQRAMRTLGVGPNVISLVPHGTVRELVMKEDFRRPARPEEIREMAALVRQGMEEGAWGMSAGLEYVPGIWSTAHEMESLVAELAPYRGVFVVHERSSGSRPMWYLPSRDPEDQPSMFDNLQEQIDIAAATGVTVVATHIKARGADFWGSSRRMIAMLQEARDKGVPIFADQYPYNTSGTDGQIVLIPGWVFDDEKAGTTPAARLKTALASDESAAQARKDIAYEITRRGGAESILIIEHADRKLVGKTLKDLADQREGDPVEAVIALQLEGDAEREGGARLRSFSMSERDVDEFAKVPWIATSSDSGITLPEDGPVHPRFYGAFPRKLRHFAIDRKLISLEEAVRVSSALPADILKLKDRGRLKVGAVADIVVFDPERVRDTADAFNTHQFCEGIDHVLVNGEPTVADGRLLRTLPGRVLARPESQAAD